MHRRDTKSERTRQVGERSAYLSGLLQIQISLISLPELTGINLPSLDPVNLSQYPFQLFDLTIFRDSKVGVVVAFFEQHCRGESRDRQPCVADGCG